MSGGGWRRLVLVRHGETDWNATGKWQGHGGGGLSHRGREQAEATARWLASTFGGVAVVVRSDLQRVAETAAPIAERLDAAMRVDARLRELDCGNWTGKTREEIASTDPERYAGWQRGADVAPGGGERVADMQARVCAALRDWLESVGSGETAVVVTHGGPIRAGTAALLGRKVTSLDDACAPVANCSATVLAWDDGLLDVERYGAVDHLVGVGTDAPAGGPL